MATLLKNLIIDRITRIPPSFYAVGFLLLILWFARPHMLNLNIMGIFVRQVVPLGILVLGQLLVIRVNSIDLSGAGVVLMVNYLISSQLLPEQTMLTYLAMSLAVGIVVGAFNGFMVGKRRVSAVIATLAVNIILVGIVSFLASGKPPGAVPEQLNDLYNTKWGFAPTPVILWVILAVILAVFLSRSVFGRNVMSVGANPTAAHFSGVPVVRTVVIAHTLAGLFSGIAAFVQTSSIVMGSARLGQELPILAVAATILGGVVFGKSDGGVWGPFFGVLSFALLFVVMTTFNIGEPGKLIAQGLIILLAAIFYGLRAGRS